MRCRPGPDGLHLFDRRTGLNILVEEFVLPPSSWALAPRQVSIALTNACDLACEYCYAPKTHATLDAGRVRAWMDELGAAGCLGVGFGGGEPTLYRRLPDLCRHGAGQTGLAVTLTTHAHRMTPALIDSLADSVHFVRVSMDGVGRTYEALRGRPFTDLLQRLDAVAAVFRFGINYVVNMRTLPDLPAAAALAAEVGAREMLLLPEHGAHGRAGIDAATEDGLRGWVRGYRGPVPLTVSEAGATGLPTADPLPSETGLRAYAHVDAAGTVKRSSYDATGIPVGAQGLLAAIVALDGEAAT